MNRTKIIVLSLLALLCSITMTAQTAATKCEYWIDRQFDSRVATVATAGEWSAQIDLSSLPAGLHSIAFRAGMGDGRWSPVNTKFFVVPQTHSTEENVLASYEYWIDRKFDERVSGTFAAGGVVETDIDMAALPPGLHSLSFRALDANGHSSAVLTRYFVVPQTHSTEENVLASYEYWIDRKFDERVSGTFAEGGIVDTDIDMSALSPGLHSLSFRALDANGHSSAVLTRFFTVPQTHSTEENVLDSYEYWIDRKFDERVSGTFAEGGIVDTDLDMSALSPGLHSLSFRALDANGHSSAVLTKNFIVVQGSDITDNTLVSWRYWIDKDETNVVEEAIDASGIIDLELDMSALSEGPHSITYQVKDANGHYSAAMTSFFAIPTDEETSGKTGDKIVAYEYWFNDNPRKRVDVEPTATLELNDVLLEIEGVEPETLPANFNFDAASKKVTYNQSFEFGLQVFNDLGTGSSAIKQTIEDYTLSIDPQFVTLANEVASTTAAPTGSKIQGFQFNSQAGQREYWFMELDESQKVDFYDADGILFNDQVYSVEVAGKQALTFLAPTATVYALTYGASDGAADNAVKVALPVSISITDAQRAYGDENPAFGFESDETALLIGTPSMTTVANKKSAVGDYAITLNMESIGNTIVNVTDGKLTVTKAMLTVTAENKERAYGEENPELTWKVEGIKNFEEIDKVCTTLPACQTEATANSDAGNYPITVSGGEAANYDFTYVPGTLTIGKAALEASMITLSKSEYEYNANDRQPTVFVTWNEKALVKGLDFDVEYADNHNVGTATVTVTGKGNYSESAVKNFTITKAMLTVTADDKVRDWGEENPELTYTISGWKGSDDETSITTLPTAYTNATIDSEAGEYAITVSGGVADNYDFTYVDGKLTITEPTGVKRILDGKFTKPVDVYNMQGVKVRSGVTSLDELPQGTYIIMGRKVNIVH